MSLDTIPPGHYYLSRRSPARVPRGFRRSNFRGWFLVADSNFTVRTVVAAGERVGIVFGNILDTSDRVDGDELRLDVEQSDGGIADRFEHALRDVLGRYVALVDDGDGLRVYTDPAGALPVLYDETEGTLAASPVAMPGVDHRSRFRDALFEEVKWPLISRGENTWLPGSITYYSGIRQLLPNHYLELDTWTSNRFWPVESALATDSDPAAEIDRIVTTLEDVFALIADRYRESKMSLTAGKDSRSLLAASHRQAKAGEISFFTLGTDERDVDTHIARQLARTHDIHWEAYPIIEASAEEQEQWLQRTAHTVGSASKEIFPTMRQIDADVEIGGLGGEIGRGYYWKDFDRRRSDVGPTELLIRFHKPEHPKLIAALEEWCSDVAQFDAYTTLDLAYQEHRLGCWGGPQHLGYPADIDYVRPLWHRPIIESVHRLPPDIRRNDELADRIVDATWPELTRLPYNSFTDWKEYWSGIRNGIGQGRAAIANPSTALDYLWRHHVRERF